MGAKANSSGELVSCQRIKVGNATQRLTVHERKDSALEFLCSFPFFGIWDPDGSSTSNVSKSVLFFSGCMFFSKEKSGILFNNPFNNPLTQECF